jgi:hypothetical protein
MRKAGSSGAPTNEVLPANDSSCMPRRFENGMIRRTSLLDLDWGVGVRSNRYFSPGPADRSVTTLRPQNTYMSVESMKTNWTNVHGQIQVALQDRIR